MNEHGKIVLTSIDGSEETFYVMEEASVSGNDYLLVAESTEDGANALFLKKVAVTNGSGKDDEITYEVLDDEREIDIIAKYFEELLEDVDLEME